MKKFRVNDAVIVGKFHDDPMTCERTQFEGLARVESVADDGRPLINGRLHDPGIPIVGSYKRGFFGWNFIPRENDNDIF